jgi:hypothetical protein
VGKLFALKQWLTVAEAARYLSIICGDEASEADVLHLALNGRLRLSVNFLNAAYARPGKIVPIEQAEYIEVPSLDGIGSVRLYGGPVLQEKGVETHVVQLEDKISTLAGVYDLPMIGAERQAVDSLYRQLAGFPAEEETINLDGAFVQGKDEVICQLQSPFDASLHKPGSTAALDALKQRIAVENLDEATATTLLAQHQEDRAAFLRQQKAQPEIDRYHPTSLPPNCIFVVRTEALRELEQRISDTPPASQKPLTANERNTYLVVIAALCDYSAIKLDRRGVANDIAKITQEFGAPVTNDTIREMLKKMPDALESRMK